MGLSGGGGGQAPPRTWCSSLWRRMTLSERVTPISLQKLLIACRPPPPPPPPGVPSTPPRQEQQNARGGARTAVDQQRLACCAICAGIAGSACNGEFIMI